MSSHDFRLHFGLGKSGEARKIEIEWPSSQPREVLTGIAANQFLEVTEGAGITAARSADSPVR